MARRPLVHPINEEQQKLFRAMAERDVLNRRVAERLGWRAWKERRGEDELCVIVGPRDEYREPWLRHRHDVQEIERQRYTEVTLAEAVKIGLWGGPRWLWAESLDACVRDIVPFAQHVFGYRLEVKFGPVLPTALFFPDPGVPHADPAPMHYLSTQDSAPHAVVEAFLMIPDPAKAVE